MEYKVLVVGFLAVDVGTRAVVPLRACLAKDPRDGAIGLDAALFAGGTQRRLGGLCLTFSTPYHLGLRVNQFKWDLKRC